MLPPDFSAQMRHQLGEAGFALFENALNAPPPVSIRQNPFKTALSVRPPSAVSRPPSTKIPWASGGFYLPERPVFTLDPTLHAGGYYVQEASSMFLESALRQSVDFSKPLKIIDLCAAPGGKSTLIASLLAADGLLVANEVIRSRVPALQENLERWGCPNVAVTSADAEDFEPLAGWFDVVVVDAPCSGEGLFRKDENARSEWSPAAVEMCAGRQKRILAAAEKLVAPGGILVFSTCTYNRSENAENCEWLAQNFDFQPVVLDIDPSWGIEKAGFSDGEGYQFYPHKVRGEGFFMSIFRKKTGGELPRFSIPSSFQKIKPLAKDLRKGAAHWLAEPDGFSFFTTPSGEVLALPKIHGSSFLMLDKFLKSKWFGVMMGQFKGRDLIPDHALALSNSLAAELPRTELELADALVFLKKENLELPGSPIGWTLPTFKNLPLGWVKILPGRVNNYLPQNRRIRMAVK